MRIGVDVGGSHIAVGLVNEKGIIIAKVEKDVKSIKENDAKLTISNTIIDLITDIVQNKKYNLKNIELIGIAFPGDIKGTYVVKAENLGIKDFNIVDVVNKKFNIPTYIKNDAKCAGLAEKKYGTLKRYKDCVFITVGTGVGGAAFLGDNLLTPIRHSGTEFGHMIICKNGLKCNCGSKGCFETYASMKKFKENIKKRINTDAEGKELRQLLYDKVEDEDVNEVIKEYLDYLSTGIANIINIFEPQAVCIGGSFVFYKEVLLKKLIKIINEKNELFNPIDIPKIITASLGNDAGIIGATII